MSRIMFTGCSGIGKTTLAKWVEETYDLPFISTSYSDLVPSTRKESHRQMITSSIEEIRTNDYQLLQMRRHLLRDKIEFVTDRCYLDSIAYWIQKLSHLVPQCDTDDFIRLCGKNLAEQADSIIFMPYNKQAMAEWVIENNHKRVLSNWYQFEVTSIIMYLLDYYNFKEVETIGSSANKYGTIEVEGKLIPVLILESLNLQIRKDVIKYFIFRYQNEQVKA